MATAQALQVHVIWTCSLTHSSFGQVNGECLGQHHCNVEHCHKGGGGVRNKLMKDWNLLNFPFLTWSGSGRKKQAASRSELLWLLSGIVKEVWGAWLCRTAPDVVAIRLRWASWGDWKDQEGEDSLVPRGICAHSDVQVAVEGEIRPNWNTNVPLYRGRNYNARDFRF